MTTDDTPFDIDPSAPPRRVSRRLALGLAIAPPLFVVALMRDGYRNRVRVIGGVWTLCWCAMGLSLAGPAENAAGLASAPEQRAAPKILVHQPGEEVRLGALAVTVEPALVRQTVGGAYFGQSAAEGGVLVVVRYRIRNAGTEPAEAYDMPQVTLMDSQGGAYEPDAGKTGAYSLETKLDQKLWSDLNPGITIKAAQVFEVSKEAFDPATWRVALDGERALVALQLTDR